MPTPGSCAGVPLLELEPSVFKKNLNASRPSEHPTQGENVVLGALAQKITIELT